MSGKDNSRVELVALMGVLKEKGLLSDQDLEQIGNTSDLARKLCDFGLIDEADLAQHAEEVEQVMKDLSEVLRADVTERKTAGKAFFLAHSSKYPKLAEYIGKMCLRD